ncbi:MAG: photosynthetic reaction center cytochrome PufC [Gemmatimonadaceae bacterium]|jgi:photosynthetic reaction center cytochrome c subunit|nr:photosynthetic reaction center cytochrome PufC [Gemmatimonadaceae bacterium]
MRRNILRSGALGAVSALAVSVSGCQYFGDASRDTVQNGYRGTALEQTYKRGDVKTAFNAVRLPAPVPAATASPPGPLPWKNVQVLNDISVGEFNRTMIAMSTWVAGTGNCAYCHNVANFASDTATSGQPLYTKLVARRMLQMTRHINSQYGQHVGATGVTCYTCHRGKPVPNGIWYYTTADQYQRHYLDRDGGRVTSQTIGPSNANRTSVRQTEWQYGLMISMSQALNVNCTYCHNSRQFASWTESPPQRAKAYHGILMLRDLNSNYLATLQPVYPAVRLGKLNDAPKAQCLTCHQGAYKPLFGARMVQEYPALWGMSSFDGMAMPTASLPPGMAPAPAATDSAAVAPTTDAPAVSAPAATPATPTASPAPSTARVPAAITSGGRLR